MENEFAKQRRHVDHATCARQSFRQPLLKVERSHRYRSRHRDGVRNRRGDPNRAVSRHDPRTVAGAHGHHPTSGIDELIAIVKVQRDHVSGGVVVREGYDLGAAIPEAIEKRALGRRRLPLLRHILSSYRKCADCETIKLNSLRLNDRGNA